jgi:hypothetical protein
MRRNANVQIVILVLGVIAVIANLMLSKETVKREEDINFRLTSLRESLMSDYDTVEVFEKGYITLLVGWAMLHGVGKTSVSELIDAVVSNQLSTLALFYEDDKKQIYEWLSGDIAKLEVTRNPENLKIWQMVQPKNCKNILPLYLNTKTGSFICGDSSNSNIELWSRGLPHLPFSPFTGPALAMDPEGWTGRQWIKYVFQGVTR